MDAQIIQRPGGLVLGVMVRINPMQADYRDIWNNRFTPREGEIARFAARNGYYGIYYGTETTGMVDFIAGMLVGEGAKVPSGLTLRCVPGGAYAVFRCTLGTIAPTWGDIYGRWFPESSFGSDDSRPAIEEFPPETHGAASPVTIYTPVKPKG